MKRVCDVCGNSSETSSLLCPFCGSKADGEAQVKHRRFTHKTINLEIGLPVVEVALNKLNETLEDAARNHVNVLTLIHGYGSSGKGGSIRLECRKMLEFFKSKGVIADYITGEDFNRRFGTVKALLRRYPQLGADKNLNRGNRGITLVILSYSVLLLPLLVP